VEPRGCNRWQTGCKSDRRGSRREDLAAAILEASGGLVSNAKALELAAAVKSPNDRKPEYSASDPRLHRQQTVEHLWSRADATHGNPSQMLPPELGSATCEQLPMIATDCG
jgi:hypothetical protein